MQYVQALYKIYGAHMREVILYGSYARGDFNSASDIDIMILVDMDDLQAKDYQNDLFDMTYDFNTDHDLDIQSIAKSESHFKKWQEAYPFYANVTREGVKLFEAA